MNASSPPPQPSPPLSFFFLSPPFPSPNPHQKITPKNSRPCSVCVCYSLPPSRLDSKARLVVLQHPHEIRRRLATVPLLSAALEKVDVPRGRRFDGERCPPCLREAVREAEERKIPVLLMFPGPGALDVKEVAEKGIPRWVAEGKESAEEEGSGGAGEEEGTTTTTTTTATESSPLAFGPVRGGEYILVAVDGTWHQGKQMFRVSLFYFTFFFFLLQEERKRRKTRLFDADHLLFFCSKSFSFLKNRTSPPGSSPLGAPRSGSSSRSETPPKSSARRPRRPWRARRRSEE